jgi:hypothetical protein
MARKINHRQMAVNARSAYRLALSNGNMAEAQKQRKIASEHLRLATER